MLNRLRNMPEKKVTWVSFKEKKGFLKKEEGGEGGEGRGGEGEGEEGERRKKEEEEEEGEEEEKKKEKVVAEISASQQAFAAHWLITMK